MTNLLGALLRSIGADESTARNTKAAKVFAETEGVHAGPEFLRIRALPRRRWQDDPQLDELVEAQTQRFRRESPEDPNAKLFPVQAVALAEAELYGRLFCVASIGPQPVDEPVLTPDGWKPIGGLKAGDFVIGSAGRPVRVNAVHYRGIQPVYKITFSDGTWTRSSKNHLWSFETARGFRITQPLYEWMSVQMFRAGKHGAKVRQYWLPELSPVQGRFTENDISLDPYTLGVIVGDGTTAHGHVAITSADPEMLTNLVLPDSVELVDTNSTRSGLAKTYRVSKKTRRSGPRTNEVKVELYKLGLMNKKAETKFVPDTYKYNTPENRLAFLQGLFDADGAALGRLCDFTTASPQLADDVCEMVESLGGTATLRVKETKLNGAEMLPAFRISVQLPPEMSPFRLTRKNGLGPDNRDRKTAQRQRVLRSPEQFDYVGDLSCVCIEVDALDHLYVTRHHILTHNSGKTLLTGLLPTALDAKRPLLLLPAALIGKTRKEFKQLSKTWRIHPAIQLFSFEKLSLPAYKTFLQDGRFDVVIADESHNLKNRKAGRTKRLGEYCERPDVVFIPLTGSPGDSSVGNIHYAHWSQREHSPVPEPSSYEALQWCQALDESVREIRRAPGALSQLSGGNHSLDLVRAGVGKRIEETPGVVYHRHASVDCSLYIDSWVHDDYSQAIEDVFAHVRETGDEMPDGRVLDTPLDRFSLFSTLNLGFCRYIDPPPPEEWRAARKAFRSYVNECLDDRKLSFDTPGEVTLALESGELTGDGGVWTAWREIEPTFKPVSKVDWFSEEILQLLSEWMNKNDALVWVPFPALGRALAKVSGRPFFHHQGLSLTIGAIEDYTKGDSVIVSTQSNSTGRNLQKWCKNLIVGPSAKADALEQQIGRTHRTGQKADAVEVTFFVGSIENLEAIDRARGRALVDKTLGRNHSSKILECDWLCAPTEEVLAAHKGPRWRK